MRPDRVVFLSPHFNQNSGFFKSGEDLAIQQLVAHLAVERFNIAVLPGTARLNDPIGKKFIIISRSFMVPLGCSWLSHHPTGSALRHILGLNGLIDSFALPVGRDHFFPAPP